MDYIQLVKRAIQYIESHLEDEINLDKIAMEENFSPYYFHRIFSAIVGESLASYIRDRRLNASIRQMKHSSKSLTEIAMIYNFSSQSAYIRSFKKKYNVTPTNVRKGNVVINEVEPPDLVERSIMNYNSDLVTKFKLLEFDEVELLGFNMFIDLTEAHYKDVIRTKIKFFLNDYKNLEIEKAFQVIFDCKNDKENLQMFIGFLNKDELVVDELMKLTLPNMVVAEFKYEGELLDVGDVIGKDLMRWSKLAKKNLHNLGISAIHEINIDEIDKMFKIIIPIE